VSRVDKKRDKPCLLVLAVGLFFARLTLFGLPVLVSLIDVPIARGFMSKLKMWEVGWTGVDAVPVARGELCEDWNVVILKSVEAAEERVRDALEELTGGESCRDGGVLIVSLGESGKRSWRLEVASFAAFGSAGWGWNGTERDAPPEDMLSLQASSTAFGSACRGGDCWNSTERDAPPEDMVSWQLEDASSAAFGSACWGGDGPERETVPLEDMSEFKPSETERDMSIEFSSAISASE
jgi:hypothetical protein